MGLELVPKSNRKPADELHDIRARMKELGEREAALREAMIAGQCSLTGDEFLVVVTKAKSSRLDTAKIKKELGLQFLRPYMRATEGHYVKLKKRDREVT